MNLSGFDDCMQAAADIQASSTGKAATHLGNNGNAPIEAGNHISQFNAGLDYMETLNTNYIPLSESGSFQYDLSVIQDNMDSIDNWLKSKLMSENGYKAVDKKQSDVQLGNKTEFLKEMTSVFGTMDATKRSDLLKSLSAYITAHSVDTVRDLVKKVQNSTEESK